MMARLGKPEITHCFSMDVEGFCDSMAESFPVPKEMIFDAASLREIEANVYETLEFLAVHSVKGTFFTLGKVAELLPAVVKAIAANGHELGSHSYDHLRLFNLSQADAREAIFSSRKILQDTAGVDVIGFRSPDFSINGQTLYILDLIVEAGYRYDSSLYPIGGHDVYGIPNLERWIHRLPNGLVEYPLSIGTLGRLRIPALGGGYFRLYPLAVTKRILNSIERAGHPAMFYIHPYELGRVCPDLPNMTWKRRFRHYVSRTKTKQRFERLFQQFHFGRVDEVLRSAGFLK